MACSARREKEIERLQGQLKALEGQRKDKTDQLIKTKSSRETLEKMREEARQIHLRQQLKLDQKQLDETAHVSFAHKGRPGRRVRDSAGG